MPGPAIFLDRDGVINRRIVGGYVRTWDEFDLLNGVVEFLKTTTNLGYKLIIITNQRGVGLGLMSQTDLDKIHANLIELLAKHGVEVTGIYACTDAEDSSSRRKPSPAMLLEAAIEHNIDLRTSWMIGDSHSDIQAGHAAGTHTAFVVTSEVSPDSMADVIIGELSELLPRL